MIKIFLSGVILLSLSAFIMSTSEWKNDPHHSQLLFTTTHLSVSEVTGTFNDFKATVHATKADFSDASFELIANVASINTRVQLRDDHLRSADFFDIEKYPTLTFKSLSLIKKSDNKYKLSGNLTICGISKPVILDLIYNGTIEHPVSKKNTAGFTASGTLKRSDYGIGPKFTDAMIGNIVKIQVSGEFTQY